MSQVFDLYSTYYDLFYRDKNYIAEVAYVDGLLTRYGSKVHKLLEFGSGTGIHGSLLANSGYEVTGIELSSNMVARAAVVEGFSSKQGDIRTLRLGQSFDAVLSLFHVMSYQVSNSDIQCAFSSAAAHLSPGGLFVFDVWYSPAVYAQKPEVRVKRIESGKLKIARIAEPLAYPNENRIDVKYTIYMQDTSSGEYHEFDEVHSMRHFSLPEIDSLAAGAGFKRIKAETFLTGAPPSEDSWGVCVVLRKI